MNGNAAAGAVIDGNSTSGFVNGIGPQPGQDSAFTVRKHASNGDSLGVVACKSALYQHQQVTFTPSEAGWYKIQTSRVYSTGRLRWSSAACWTPAGTVSSFVKADLNFVSLRNGQATLITQNSFSFAAASATPAIPYADKIFVGGTRHGDRFLRINQVPTGLQPITLVWDTTQRGVALLDHPVRHIDVTAIEFGRVNHGTSIVTIHTAQPHGFDFSAKADRNLWACTLFDTQCTPSIEGEHRVIVTGSNVFTLTVPIGGGTPAGISGTKVGEFFSSTRYQCDPSFPSGPDRFFQLTRTSGTHR